LRKEVLSHKTIAITGANGFIGSNLKNYFLSQGYYIKCFQRTNIKEQEKRVTFINYDLQLPLSTNDFLNVDILVHCAFATHSNKCKNADEINVNAAERIIEMCRLNKIKIIFLSSFSAHSSAQSHYGLNKLLLENMFDQKRDLILKLGLIVGNGGMFLKIKKLLDNKYIIPLIDNGNHPVQTIGMQDLLKICHVAINKEIVGKYYIAEEKSRTIKSIFLIIREKKSRNLFLPISTKSFIIPHGHPMYHLMPMTDKQIDIRHHHISKEEMEQYEMPSITFKNIYLTAKNIMDKKRKCPFHWGE
jgi:nucleoside-diphosphate-sugar epimerase